MCRKNAVGGQADIDFFYSKMGDFNKKLKEVIPSMIENILHRELYLW